MDSQSDISPDEIIAIPHEQLTESLAVKEDLVEGNIPQPEVIPPQPKIDPITNQPPQIDTKPLDEKKDVDNSQTIVVERTNMQTGENEEIMRFAVPHIHSWSMNSPIPNQMTCVCGAKADIETPKHPGGRPCKYCLNKEHYIKIAEEYLKRHEEGEKPKIPFIEELALKMRIDDETLVIWAKKLKKDAIDEYGDVMLEHPELSAIYYLLRTTQKFRLKQRAMGRYNPVGALSLLRFDHGAIETSKQVHAGDPNEPIQITIVEEDNHVAEN